MFLRLANTFTPLYKTKKKYLRIPEQHLIALKYMDVQDRLYLLCSQTPPEHRLGPQYFHHKV